MRRIGSGFLECVEQHIRSRFHRDGASAADDGVEKIKHAELFQNRYAEHIRLIGGRCKTEARRFQNAETIRRSRIERGMNNRIVAVSPQNLFCCVFRVDVLSIRNCEGGKPGDSVSDIPDNRFLRQGNESVMFPHPVCRKRNILNGVDEGSVEVENNTAVHARLSLCLKRNLEFPGNAGICVKRHIGEFTCPVIAAG